VASLKAAISIVAAKIITIQKAKNIKSLQKVLKKSIQ